MGDFLCAMCVVSDSEYHVQGLYGTICPTCQLPRVFNSIHLAAGLLLQLKDEHRAAGLLLQLKDEHRSTHPAIRRVQYIDYHDKMPGYVIVRLGPDGRLRVIE